MEYTKEHPLRVMTLASGYDSQCLALERLKQVFPEFDYELVAWAEFDPESNLPIEKQPAIIAHNALFPQWADRNYGDITKIDWEKVPDFDLLFQSTPCQSISAAGLQHGFEKSSGTRSSIIWNVHDCVRIKRPRFIASENVAAILSSKFLSTLQLWLKELERMGYVNFMPPEFPTPWNKSHTKNGCLNSKDYGVAQNRLRWFSVSILREEGKDEPAYNFPKPFELTTCLADVLESEVGDEYFLSDTMLARFAEKSLEEEESGVVPTFPKYDDELEGFFMPG